MKCKNKNTCKRVKNCTDDFQAVCKLFEEDKSEKLIAKEELGARELAKLIHYKTCNCNHTDECGWEYESWENPSGEFSAKTRALSIAKNILKIVNLQTALDVINCLKRI